MKRQNKLMKQVIVWGLILVIGASIGNASVMTAHSANTSAPPVASGNVEQRIEQLRTLFPHDSYFSVNGQRCPGNHIPEGHWRCNHNGGNCNVSDVMLRRLGYTTTHGIRDGSTCVAFARFAFFFLFGIADNTAAYSGIAPPGSHLVPVTEMRPGDMVVFGRHHYGIFLEYRDGQLLYFHSNARYSNKVAYRTQALHPWGAVMRPTFAFRADNWDEVNDSPVNRTAPTISNVRVSNVDSTGYTVTATVTSTHSDVARVQFPSWNRDIHIGDQATWIEGRHIGGNDWQARINIADLRSGAIAGYYATHIWTTDSAGNRSRVGQGNIGYAPPVFVNPVVVESAPRDIGTGGGSQTAERESNDNGARGAFGRGFRVAVDVLEQTFRR